MYEIDTEYEVFSLPGQYNKHKRDKVNVSILDTMQISGIVCGNLFTYHKCTLNLSKNL